MNRLTHQQAQRLLHAKTDHALSTKETAVLQTHLTTCLVCQNYAMELTTLENRIRRVLHAHWPPSRPITDPLIAVQTYSRKTHMNQPSLRFAGTLLTAVLLLLTLTGILTFLLPELSSLPTSQLTTTPEITAPNPTPLRPEENTPPEIAQQYTVQNDDTLWSIAEAFGLQPETILWANEMQLFDNADFLQPEMILTIPPADGVYYQVQEGDTLETIATDFEANVEDIVAFPGNFADPTHPTPISETYLLIPGGHRDLRPWLIPNTTRDDPQALRTYGPGACLKSSEGVTGAGMFQWPLETHYLSGNDFWSAHPGIDIAASLNEDVFASDAGVVIFSGWSNFGYGYLIMLDHGNGYLTIYAHLNKVVARCGESVTPGQIIGNAGITGNTTGPHLHFEIRLNDEPVNPWTVLPLP